MVRKGRIRSGLRLLMTISVGRFAVLLQEARVTVTDLGILLAPHNYRDELLQRCSSFDSISVYSLAS